MVQGAWESLQGNFVFVWCYGLNICVFTHLPPNSYAVSLTTSEAILGDRASLEVITLNEFMRVEFWSNRIGVLIRKETGELSTLSVCTHPGNRRQRIDKEMVEMEVKMR